MDISELWAIFGPGVAGAVFGAGWWFWVDAVVCSSVTISFLHYLPGIFASLAALMFNCVRKEDIDYSPYDEGEWSYTVQGDNIEIKHDERIQEILSNRATEADTKMVEVTVDHQVEAAREEEQLCVFFFLEESEIQLESLLCSVYKNNLAQQLLLVRLKLWLFIAYVVSFVSLAASVGLLIQDALGKSGPSAWAGVAGVLQCVFVLISISSILEQQRNNPELGFRFFIWAAKRGRFCSWVSQNLIVDMLVNDNGFDLYWNALDKLKVDKAEKAVEAFGRMKEFDCKPNLFTYNMVLHITAKRADDAHRLLSVMKSRGCMLDFIAYNALLNGFCKLGRINEAQALLRSFENEGYLVDIKGYTCLIDGFVRTKRIDEAQSVFRSLFENNVVPDVVLYTTMIRGLSGAGRVKEALSLLRDMTGRGVQPDTQCYNTLIKGFCDMGLLDQARNGLMVEARHIFNEMEKLGCFPSVVTFNTLIDGLCKAGELEEARLMFYKMEIGKNPSLFLRLSQGADRVLDSASLQKIVEKLCESGKILKAYKLLMQLADFGVTPNIVTYNILINGLCKSGKMNGAFKLFEELQVKGHSPDSITYGTLIDGLQRVDKEEEAFKLLDQMSKNGCMPSAEFLRNQAVRDGEVLGLMEEHLEKGDLEKVVRGLLEMDLKLEDFDSSPYNIWLIGMCQGCKPGEALKISSLLEEFHVMISAPSCVMLIHSLCEEGNLDQAVEEKVFLYTVERGVRLMPQICNRLLQSLLCSQDKAHHAVDLLERTRSVGYNLNDYLYSGTKSLFQRWNRRETENLSPG
ncbi:hypothetical protein RND71_028201 [Anisodus tanguticus]|uniref:Pentatricopeptide repeat-containing protein n=1 Tax=Anisodus tanguticus TaxID=243964 RepID=A0AAE1RKS2_9SOLA|nr:hypothetical protein RND71_028201 [Anisodus tanguticus]